MSSTSSSGARVAERLERGRAVARPVDLVAVGGQAVGHDGAEVVVVLDEQDAGGHGALNVAAPRRPNANPTRAQQGPNAGLGARSAAPAEHPVHPERSPMPTTPRSSPCPPARAARAPSPPTCA